MGRLEAAGEGPVAAAAATDGSVVCARGGPATARLGDEPVTRRTSAEQLRVPKDSGAHASSATDEKRASGVFSRQRLTTRSRASLTSGRASRVLLGTSAET